MSENPRVFISYSHQSVEYENKVLSFADKLRSEGIDANIDLYEEAPPEGWPRWMENQIRLADFVLVIGSKSYYDKCYSDNKGKGIGWEVNIVYQHIYDGNSETEKFIPVFFDDDDIQYILTPIKPFTYYNLSRKEEYEKLYWRLRGVTRTHKPPLGKLRPLPEKERKMFFTSPIDLDKWHKASWIGVLYLFPPGHGPILGLLYEDYAAAKSIFSEWRRLSTNGSVDEFLKIDYVVPPFPKDCWIYPYSHENRGEGYFVHIGPNTDKDFKRAIDSGVSKEELLLTTLSRYRWVDELNGSANRDKFKRYVDRGSNYLLIPVGIRDNSKPIQEGNIVIDDNYGNYAVIMKNVTFHAGVDIKDDNICKVVLNKVDIE